MVVLGTVFAVIIAKQLYGGLGQNPFNPAMIGYVVLLISFPVQMTSWLPPHEIAVNIPGFIDAIQVIFSGHTTSGGDMNTLRLGIDGISQATPLDTFKTSVRAGHSVEEIMQYPIYSGILAGAGWQWVNLAWLAGGVWLLWQKAIRWHIPLSFLVTLALCATLGWLFSPDTLAAPQIHLLSGATMLGAFFILTDPVTASTTNRGRLIFGALAGLLVWMIRSFGGYPDGVAFCRPAGEHHGSSDRLLHASARLRPSQRVNHAENYPKTRHYVGALCSGFNRVNCGHQPDDQNDNC
ncbi:electron transport complex protein [Escherichia coli]|uniref:Electron transport complex protein n=1 Tax=Escherichia coli TaxID=562 RepID=A0A376W446_ECOLX|nr:electron transport complex protein [Escherichia coli]